QRPPGGAGPLRAGLRKTSPRSRSTPRGERRTGRRGGSRAAPWPHPPFRPAISTVVANHFIMGEAAGKSDNSYLFWAISEYAKVASKETRKVVPRRGSL